MRLAETLGLAALFAGLALLAAAFAIAATTPHAVPQPPFRIALADTRGG